MGKLVSGLTRHRSLPTVRFLFGTEMIMMAHDTRLIFMRALLLWSALAAGLAGSGCDKKAAARSNGTARLYFAVQVIAVEAKRQAVSETLSQVGTIAANEMV